MVKQKQIKNKCVEGDSNHWASTGIQRHRLRALFGREGFGNTAGADWLKNYLVRSADDEDALVQIKVGQYVCTRYGHERENGHSSFFNAGGTAG